MHSFFLGRKKTENLVLFHRLFSETDLHKHFLYLWNKRSAGYDQLHSSEYDSDLSNQWFSGVPGINFQQRERTEGSYKEMVQEK